MDMKRLIFLLASLLTITACSHSSGSGSNDSGTGSSHASEASPSASGRTDAKPTAQASTESEADRSTPLSSYTAPTGQPWLTYIYVSRLNPQPSDEDKMKLFSPAYYNEPDTFKKHDILVADLPRVESTLAEYKAQSYYVFKSENPFTGSDTTMLNPYDFNTQSFEISGPCDRYPNHVGQGIVLRLAATPGMCNLKIADAATARTIENLRANYQLDLVFTTYFFVDGINPRHNEIEGTITRLHVDFDDRRSRRTIASLDIN